MQVGKMRFLVVDDSIFMCKILNKMLSVYGLCELTYNGEQAVNAFQSAVNQNNPYDMIFLDIVMPVKDGLVALHEIRNIEQASNLTPVPVVIVTSVNDIRSIVVNFHKDKNLLFFAKPIGVKDIKYAICKFMCTRHKDGDHQMNCCDFLNRVNE